jgi:hypothetical protein
MFIVTVLPKAEIWASGLVTNLREYTECNES